MSNFKRGDIVCVGGYGIPAYLYYVVPMGSCYNLYFLSFGSEVGFNLFTSEYVDTVYKLVSDILRD